MMPVSSIACENHVTIIWCHACLICW